MCDVRSSIGGAVTWIVATAMCVAAPLRAGAQEWQENMAAFRQICLDARTAIMELDAERVKACRDAFRSFQDKWDIDIFRLRPAPGQKELSLRGHIVYDAVGLDSLLKYNIDLSSVDVDPHSMHRGGGTPSRTIYVEYKVVPAGGQLSYSYKGEGKMGLFVMAEYETVIKLTVVSDGIEREVLPTTIKGLQECCWEVDSGNSGTTFTIFNPSDEPLACTIVSN